MSCVRFQKTSFCKTKTQHNRHFYNCQMRFCLLLLVVVVLSLGSLSLGASTTWYFSSTEGISTNSGHTASSPLPLSSTSSLPSTIKTGDTLLLKSGDTFNIYSLSLTKANLTLSFYGSGAAPIIDGGIRITSWDTHSTAGIFTVSLIAEI